MDIAVTYKGVLLACLLGMVLAQENSEIKLSEKSDTPVSLNTPTELPKTLTTDLPDKLEEARLLQQQAENAAYNFTATLVDEIMDNKQGRQESRKGLQVEGSYWYSDGFVRRSVTYVADQDGYRVVSETSEPLGNGPVADMNGRAEIYTNIAGQASEYNITNDDIAQYEKFKRTSTTISPTRKE